MPLRRLKSVLKNAPVAPCSLLQASTLCFPGPVSIFRAQTALTYRPKQMQSAYQLLTQLLDDQTHYEAHITTYVPTQSVRHVLRTLLVVLLMHRFVVSVVMAVTYGCGMNGRETFVTSIQRAGDILVRVATPEISALCNAFPFSGCLSSDLTLFDCCLICECRSRGIAGMVSRNGAQASSCRMSTSFVRGVACIVRVGETTHCTSQHE